MVATYTNICEGQDLPWQKLLIEARAGLFVLGLLGGVISLFHPVKNYMLCLYLILCMLVQGGFGILRIVIINRIFSRLPKYLGQDFFALKSQGGSFPAENGQCLTGH